MKENSAPVRAEEPVKTKDWLDRREAAEFCGLTVATMDQYRQLRGKGIDRGPAFERRGWTVLYARAECEAWLQRRKGA